MNYLQPPPPPPPPPPPVMMPIAPAPTPVPVVESQVIKPSKPSVPDIRSDLMDSIRKGAVLRVRNLNSKNEFLIVFIFHKIHRKSIHQHLVLEVVVEDLIPVVT